METVVFFLFYREKKIETERERKYSCFKTKFPPTFVDELVGFLKKPRLFSEY